MANSKEPTTIHFLVARSWHFRAETNDILPCGLVGKSELPSYRRWINQQARRGAIAGYFFK
jgi:hypothetical protein